MAYTYIVFNKGVFRNSQTRNNTVPHVTLKHGRANHYTFRNGENYLSLYPTPAGNTWKSGATWNQRRRVNNGKFNDKQEKMAHVLRRLRNAYVAKNRNNSQSQSTIAYLRAALSTYGRSNRNLLNGVLRHPKALRKTIFRPY